ncbi:MAG: glycoside hydrolase family 3 protein [Erysipelotrichaceae bacterium]|nr:glycoside hydrolase family 3 protein [Erysipelotrichaceae bacterium]
MKTGKTSKTIILILLSVLILTACGQKADTKDDLASCRYQEYAGMSAEEIVFSLTMEQKAMQMVQPACYNTDPKKMKKNCYGSILSRNFYYDSKQWRAYIGSFQEMAVRSEAGIPFIYGQDDVHGVNYALNTVIFPHNIGLGAADDEELMYQIGQITADEAKLCHMLWNFAPCIAQSNDPRWGRTYESYGSDLEAIKRLSTAYTKGLQDGGIIACAKHFFGDGNVAYGSGEGEMLIDRGDAVLNEEEIEALLSVYQAQIDAGVRTIMISHSSVNGIKMHENRKYIDLLKNEMGFKGFVVSDWNSIQNTSKRSYYDQVVTGINAGIDMLMEVDHFDEAASIIVKAVENGDISQERVDDAVRRILQVKMDIGVIADPFCEKMETVQKETGSKGYREIAEKAVEESLVLIRNQNDILPLREGTKIYVTGPAANNDVAQCGGWTMDWNQSNLPDIPGVTSIREGFLQKAEARGITLTDKAEDADVIILVLGEKAYAEWNGDAEDLDLCGEFGLSGNKEAIDQANALGKPVVSCIVAGRNVFISDYMDRWDAVVMCYLPGSEGQGVADVLCGECDFQGTLPSPWYDSVLGIETKTAWLERGFGLTYKENAE